MQKTKRGVSSKYILSMRKAHVSIVLSIRKPRKGRIKGIGAFQEKTAQA